MKLQNYTYKKTLLTTVLMYTILLGCGIHVNNTEKGLYFLGIPAVYGTGVGIETLLVNDTKIDYTVLTPCNYLGIEKYTDDEWVEIYLNTECTDTVRTALPSGEGLVFNVPYVLVADSELPPPGEFRFNIFLLDNALPSDTARFVSQLFNIR